MSTGSISTLIAPTHAPVRTSRFRFELATPDDNAELLRFSRSAEMPGAIRFSFDRNPDYLGALCVEGRQSEVLVCREAQNGRVVAIGHRSVKSVFVNGQPTSVGYLSGLRLDQSVRNRQILAHGYAFLRKLHAARPVQMYLSTIMEDNLPAKAVLLSGRSGLPGYHDFGRFCCMAVSLQFRSAGSGRSGIRVRHASAADGPAIIEFLNREGRSRQFFPQYQVGDFGPDGGLLSHLQWEDVFTAFRGEDLIGVGVPAMAGDGLRRLAGTIADSDQSGGKGQENAAYTETGFAAGLFHSVPGLCPGQRSLSVQGLAGGGSPREEGALRLLLSGAARAGPVAG
jgi:hypothetical protein